MRMYHCLLATFCLFVLSQVSFAQSQGPTPGPPAINQKQQSKPTPEQQLTNNGKQRTEESSADIKTKVPQSRNPEKPNDAERSNEKSSNDWTFVDVALTIFNGLLVVFTYKLWRSTDKLWKAAQDQSMDMKASIDHAIRSADAMESVAKSMEENVIRLKEMATFQESVFKKQLRARLSIGPGQYYKQDREKSAKFGLQVMIVNGGPTPARNAKVAACVTIMDNPLPINFDPSGSLPNLPTIALANIISGQLPFVSVCLNEFIPEQELQQIIIGTGIRRAYIFGAISYEDVFGEAQHTKFFRSVTWDNIAGRIFFWTIDRHNDAT